MLSTCGSNVPCRQKEPALRGRLRNRTKSTLIAFDFASGHGKIGYRTKEARGL